MGTLLGVLVVLVVIAITAGPTLLTLFSRRYPRRQRGPERREPPASQ